MRGYSRSTSLHFPFPKLTISAALGTRRRVPPFLSAFAFSRLFVPGRSRRRARSLQPSREKVSLRFCSFRPSLFPSFLPFLPKRELRRETAPPQGRSLAPRWRARPRAGLSAPKPSCPPNYYDTSWNSRFLQREEHGAPLTHDPQEGVVWRRGGSEGSSKEVLLPLVDQPGLPFPRKSWLPPLQPPQARAWIRPIYLPTRVSQDLGSLFLPGIGSL